MIDLHCDTLSLLLENKNSGLKENRFCVDLKKLRTVGSTAQFFACFVDLGKFSAESRDENGYKTVLELLNLGKRQILENDIEIDLAKSFEDYRQNTKHKKISAFLTVEEGGILGENIDRLDALYREGVRLVTLSWNYENSLGFPNSRDKNVMQKGLKPFGFSVVERMNRLGMIIDVSHLSDGGCWDVLSHSTKPVIASHSCARALCDHPRNLSDEMMRASAEKGGVAGVNFYPFFLRSDGKARAEDLAEHIIYMQKIGGEDFVAIGTDFDGFSASVSDVSHIGQIEKVFNILRIRGMTERQIEKIRKTNAERIIKEVL